MTGTGPAHFICSQLPTPEGVGFGSLLVTVRLGEREVQHLAAALEREAIPRYEAVEYAGQFDDPVIVLEDLSYIRESLDYGKWMNCRLHA